MVTRKATALQLLSLCVALWGCTPATEQSVEAFYKGKTIMFYTAGGPGGALDLYARSLAPFLTKHLPGHPAVVVDGMIGAGGLPMLRNMQSRLPQDGTVLGLFISVTVPLSLIDPANMGFDFGSLHYIGNMTTDTGVCFSWAPRGGITAPGDLEKRAVTFADTSAGGVSFIYSTMLGARYGANVRHVSGYLTQQNALFALERGEVDVNCWGYGVFETFKPHWLEEKTVNIFVKFAEANEGPAALSAVPSVYDLGYSDEEKQAIRLFAKAIELTLPIATTPGTPPERVAALREAFDKAMADPEFLAVAAKQHFTTQAMSGAEVDRTIRSLLATPPEIVQIARKFSAAGQTAP